MELSKTTKKPKLLIVGTFHMRPTTDFITSEIDDLSSDRRQQEISGNGESLYMNETKIKELCSDIIRCNSDKKSILIGIDGCGGAGKSTFARKLKREFDQTTTVSIVHMDDFYLPAKEREEIKELNLIGSDFDWRRLLEQVIKPISSGVEGFYQRYDWNLDKLVEWNEVPLGIVIIEGVYCLRSELFDYYDYSVWIETDYNTRLARGIERDGTEMQSMWVDVWMPAEQHYKDLEKPYEKAKLVINGYS